MSEEAVTPAEEVITTTLATPAAEVDAAKETPPAAEVAAPVAEPESSAVEAPAPAEEAPTEEAPAEEHIKSHDLDHKVWGDTGSTVGNSVLGYLQDAGVTPEDAKALLFDAAQSGDVTQIDPVALEAKLGKHGANIVMAGAKTFIAEGKTKVAEVSAVVHSAVGGEETWNKVRDWAVDNVAEEVLAEYRPMIDKGGAAARFAAHELAGLYNGDTANSSVQLNTRAEPTSVSPPASAALSRAQYVKALDDAYKKNASPAEISKLKAAREAGRKQGL